MKIKTLTKALLLATLFPTSLAFCQNSLDLGANVGARLDRFCLTLNHAPSDQTMQATIKNIQLATIGAYANLNFAENFFLRYDLTYGFGINSPKVSKNWHVAEFTGAPPATTEYETSSEKIKSKRGKQYLWDHQFQLGMRYALNDTMDLVPHIGVEFGRRKLAQVEYSSTLDTQTNILLRSCAPFVGIGLQCHHNENLSLGISVDYMRETARFRRNKFFWVYQALEPSTLKLRGHAIRVETKAKWQLSDQWCVDVALAFKASRGKRDNDMTWRDISTNIGFEKYKTRTTMSNRSLAATAGFTYIF